MTGTLFELPTRPAEITLRLGEVGLAYRDQPRRRELRSRGGLLIANVPEGITITRPDAAALVVAWLDKGGDLGWREAEAVVAASRKAEEAALAARGLGGGGRS